MQSAPVEGFDSIITGTNDYADTANSDVVVITAGLARKPGMSRDDLLKKNASIVKSCSEQIAKHSPNAIVIVVSNPLDVMCNVALVATGFIKNRVFGLSSVLVSYRTLTFIVSE